LEREFFLPPRFWKAKAFARQGLAAHISGGIVHRDRHPRRLISRYFRVFRLGEICSNSALRRQSTQKENAGAKCPGVLMKRKNG